MYFHYYYFHLNLLLELNDFVLQLDEEVEGMESTICALQQQLKETKQKYQNSIEEVEQLRNMADHTTGSQHDLKRIYDAVGNDIIEIERKRAKSATKVIENDTTIADEGKEGARTKTNTEGDHRLNERNAIIISSKNQFFGNKLLPRDEKMTKEMGKEPIDDETFDVPRTQKSHLKEGTNGEMYDS